MSKIKCLILGLALFLLPSISLVAGDNDLTAEQLIAEHLKSIGNPEAISQVKARAFVGTSSVNFIQGMYGSLAGQSMFVSEGKNLGLVMKFGDINYPQEYFAYDGKEVSVGYINPGQKSPLADFLFRYNGFMKSGLMAGVLSGSWPLLDPNQKAELKIKQATIEGKRLYEVEYQPKPILRDMKIKLYFDSQTFHHVRTECSVRIKDDASVRGISSNPPVLTPNSSAAINQALPESIYVLTEKFDDFKEENGMVLPHSYTLDYSLEGQGGSFVANWVIKPSKWEFNKTYDARIFKAQK